jgi:hypothetical protein
MSDLHRLSHAERLQLLKFVAAAIWADLEVSPAEKTYLLSLALRLGLSDRETELVRGWLETPPPTEELDPSEIPAKHRRLFLDAIEQAVTADHAVDVPERQSLALLRELLQ